jgi:hypothetical protein
MKKRREMNWRSEELENEREIERTKEYPYLEK